MTLDLSMTFHTLQKYFKTATRRMDVVWSQALTLKLGNSGCLQMDQQILLLKWR